MCQVYQDPFHFFARPKHIHYLREEILSELDGILVLYLLIDEFGVSVLSFNEVHERGHNLKESVEHVVDEGVHEPIVIVGRPVILLGFLPHVDNYDSDDVHHDAGEAHTEAYSS